jgi:hypothetical protein
MDVNGNEKRSRRQSGEPVWDADEIFPRFDKFQPPTKLPSIRSAIGRLRNLTSGGKYNMSFEKASREVAKQIFSKYYHDTIYCVPYETITEFKDGKKRLAKGREQSEAVTKFKEMVLSKDKLLDMSTSDPNRMLVFQEEWGIIHHVQKKATLPRGSEKMQVDGL